MSYIFIDFDEARRCAALFKEQTVRLRAAIGTADEKNRGLIAFCEKLDALTAELTEETETLAAVDDRMKELHHMMNDGGVSNGQ